MIANVTPAGIYYEETLSTLNYANRAKNIRVMLKKNVLEREDMNLDKSLVKKAEQDKIVNSLKNEILELKKLLSERDSRKESKSQNKNRDAVSTISSDNKTKEFLDHINKMQRIINDHFQEEIKLTKDIVGKEKEIASKKVELKGHQINLVNFPSKVELNEKINLLSKEIEKNYKLIEDKQTLQENYIKKRSEIRKMIGLQNNEYARSFLHDYVEYFLLMIKNFNLEGKKFADSAELKIKDLQLDALTSQIRAKDLFIEKTNLKAETGNKAKSIDFKKDVSSQGKNINLDIELINGLKGRNSVNKLQIVKSQVDKLDNDLKYNDKNNNINRSPKAKYEINMSGKDNNNYIQNFKRLIRNVSENKSPEDNKNKRDNPDEVKESISETNLKKIESTKNNHGKNLYTMKKANDAYILAGSKSPENNKAYNIQIKEKSDILLNRKSITDKSNLRSSVDENLKKKNLPNNRKENRNVFNTAIGARNKI